MCVYVYVCMCVPVCFFFNTYFSDEEIQLKTHTNKQESKRDDFFAFKIVFTKFEHFRWDFTEFLYGLFNLYQ